MDADMFTNMEWTWAWNGHGQWHGHAHDIDTRQGGDLDTGHGHGLRAWIWTRHGISDVQKRAGKTEDYVVFIGFFGEE